MRYNLLVIGDAPGGPEGALAAAKLNQRVALVEPLPGTLGTSPFETAAVSLAGMRAAIGSLPEAWEPEEVANRPRHERFTMNDLQCRLQEYTRLERESFHSQFEEHGVDRYLGDARFVGEREVEVHGIESKTLLKADNILLACGTRPAKPRYVPFDGKSVFDTESVLAIERPPQSLIVIGGRGIGLEYAVLFAAMGARVTVVDHRPQLVNGHDDQRTHSLCERARALGAEFQLGDDFIGIDVARQGRVVVYLENGRRIAGESALVDLGRIGNTQRLNLPAVGIAPDEHGRLWCNANHQTWLPHVYAVGDIVGFPWTNKTPTAQAHIAIRHALDSQTLESKSRGVSPRIRAGTARLFDAAVLA